MILLFSLLPIFTLPASGFSGKWTRSFDTYDGKSTYTLVLDSPDEVTRNTNLTITTSLLLDHMDKYKQYFFYSTIELTIETDTGSSIKRTISFGNYPIGEQPKRLYPGSRWGPNTFTIDLSNETINIPFGGAVDATIYARVNIAEFVNNPFLVEQLPSTTYESFSVTAGTFRIINESNFMSDYFPYIIGLTVGITIFIGLVLRNQRSSN